MKSAHSVSGHDHEAALSVVGLTKHYANRNRVGMVHALDELELPAGRVLSLLTPPSRGASGLNRTVGDFRRPKTVKGYLSTVQVVFQDPFSSRNPAKRIEQILERRLLLHDQATQREPGKRPSELLNQVGPTPPGEFLGKHPYQVSAGQRPRVGIARALATGSRGLLANESVSMLDRSIRAGILNLLAGRRDSRGVALLYITQDLAARHLSDEIVVRYAGEALEYGPSHTVVGAGKRPYTKAVAVLRAKPRGAQAQSRASKCRRPSGSLRSPLRPPVSPAISAGYGQLFDSTSHGRDRQRALGAVFSELGRNAGRPSTRSSRPVIAASMRMTEVSSSW